MPTLQELIDLEFATQEALNYQKVMASRQPGYRQPDRREAAVELQAAMMTAPVEATRANLLPVGESPPAPVKPEAYCKYCGKVFKAKTVGMAKMQKNRHEKKSHDGESASS